jgi:hypothetical protein
MAVNVENITIEKGTDFSKQFTILNSDGSAFDLSNYTFTAKLRKWGAAANPVSFATTYGADATLGKLTISLSDTITGILTSGRSLYDVLITSGVGTITKIREGMVIIRDTTSL